MFTYDVRYKRNCTRNQVGQIRRFLFVQKTEKDAKIFLFPRGNSMKIIHGATIERTLIAHQEHYGTKKRM